MKSEKFGHVAGQELQDAHSKELDMLIKAVDAMASYLKGNEQRLEIEKVLQTNGIEEDKDRALLLAFLEEEKGALIWDLKKDGDIVKLFARISQGKNSSGAIQEAIAEAYGRVCSIFKKSGYKDEK